MLACLTMLGSAYLCRFWGDKGAHEALKIQEQGKPTRALRIIPKVLFDLLRLQHVCDMSRHISDALKHPTF